MSSLVAERQRAWEVMEQPSVTPNRSAVAAVETRSFNEGGPLFKRCFGNSCWKSVETYPPCDKISESKLKEQCSKLCEQKDLNALKNLAYDLFNTPGSGLLGGAKGSHILLSDAPSVYKLAYKLAPFRIEDITEIASLIIKGVDEYREKFNPSIFYSEDSQMMKDATEEGVYRYSKCDPESYVRISHGGGERSIHDFLDGKSPGYPLDSGDLGIQVHPLSEGYNTEANVHELAPWYAQKSINFFDQPAILTGRIQWKYLTPAPNFPNEAGIKPQHVKYLEDRSVRVLN